MADQKELILSLRIQGTKQQEQNLTSLKRRMLETANEVKKLRKATRDNLPAQKAAANRFKKLELQLKADRRAYNQLNKEILINNGQMKRSTGLTKGITQGFQTFALRIGGATAAIALITRGLKDAFDIVKNFEQANADLAAVLGKTRDEIRALSDDAIRLGGSTKFTATEISKLQKEFAKLGFSEQEILDATEATLDLAAATNTELAEAAKVAGATVRGFGLDARETQRVVDVMAKSFSSSALDMEKFSTAMGKVAPVAKAVGLTIEDTTALMGTLSDAGIEASISGTSLRKIFIELARKGISLKDALAKIKGSQDKLTTATELFGVRAATAGLVLAENTDRTAALNEELQEAGGTAEDMADEQLDTLEGSITFLTSAYEKWILELSRGNSVIKDSIRSLIDFTTTLFDAEKQSIATKAILGFLKLNFQILIFPIKTLIKAALLITKSFFDLGAIIGTALLPTFEKLSTLVRGIANDIIVLTNIIIQSGFAKKLTSIIGIELTNIEKLQSNAEKRRLDALKKHRKKIKRQITDSNKIIITNEEKTTDDIIEDDKKKVKATEKTGAERLKLVERNAKLRIEIERAAIDAILAEQLRLIEETKNTSDAIIEGLLAEMEAKAEIRLLEATTIEEEKEAKLLVEEARFQAELNSLTLANNATEEQIRAFQSRIELAALEHEKNKTKIAQKATNQRKQIAVQFAQASIQLFGVIAGAFADQKERELKSAEGNNDKQDRIRRKFAIREKSLLIAQAVANIALGVIRALGSAPPPINIVLAAITAGAGAVQIGRIASTQFKRGGIAETGGILKGKSHTQGGIPFTVGGVPGFEAQGNEPILTAGVGNNPMLRAAASALNVAGGGVSFEHGGIPIHKFQAGSVTPGFTGGARLQTSEALDISLMTELLGEEIAVRMNDLRVVNVASETTAVQTDIENIESEATFG